MRIKRIPGRQRAGFRKHANFVNTGGATLTDIETLLTEYRQSFKQDPCSLKYASLAITKTIICQAPQYSPAQYGKVAVLYGGRSAEREISLSGRAVWTA